MPNNLDEGKVSRSINGDTDTECKKNIIIYHFENKQTVRQHHQKVHRYFRSRNERASVSDFNDILFFAILFLVESKKKTFRINP